ncbi:MAG TPA: thioesterase family protein [Acidimicrobiales bacterium]
MGTPSFADQMARLQADPDQPGRYHVDVDPCWNCPVIPQGGTMAALATAAMTAELADPGQRLRTQTTVFASAVPAGAVTIDVSVLRRGRSMSQVTATTRAAGADVGHTTVAVFGRDRPGFEFTDLTMPSVALPAGAPSFRDPPPPEVASEFQEDPFPFWEQVEGRPVIGRPPWEPYVPTSSECAFWYSFDDPPLLPSGALDPLAVVALADLMPSSVGQRMGPLGRQWLPPSADLTVHVFAEARSRWLLAHLRARQAGDGYASVEAALWDEHGTLVAHASQIMFLVFPDGAPEGDERFPPDLR